LEKARVFYLAYRWKIMEETSMTVPSYFLEANNAF
jgi:hypothetical protein